MDLNMPQMDGIETTLKLRQLEADGLICLRNCSFVLYSCLSNTQDVEALRENFDDVAKKPAEIEDLQRILFEFI